MRSRFLQGQQKQERRLMAWKYVMLRWKLSGSTAVDLPIIFPDKLVHADVAAAIMAMMEVNGYMKSDATIEPISAGMIEIILPEGLGGKSETLGLESVSQDATLIRNYAYNHGIADLNPSDSFQEDEGATEYKDGSLKRLWDSLMGSMEEKLEVEKVEAIEPSSYSYSQIREVIKQGGVVIGLNQLRESMPMASRTLLLDHEAMSTKPKLIVIDSENNPAKPPRNPRWPSIPPRKKNRKHKK
jgi:hypothetical protein